jgi:Protein of unknown function (DUF3224)
MNDHAHGTFDVTITPQPADDSGIGRLDLAKRWHGDLLATGTGLMLSAGDPTLGRAGYVALETVTGTLHGREGGFAFQQYGVMRGDARELRYGVVPGSGTGALTGLEGTLTLTIDDDGTHTYDLDYTLE